MELAPRYNPRQVEDKCYRFWQDSGFFHAEPEPKKKPYCIVIPPPNITGILHMGHALNNTIQDILIRFRRMQGYCSLWIPGTDHAGIATQNVVEKALAAEGLSRQDLGREKFLERLWQWKEKYGSTIIKQLKKLGCSCDWSRTRFTLDKGLYDAVLEVFIRLYKKGLIYRGNYIINWCVHCQTALSDEEVIHKEIRGSLYYIKYPLKNSSFQTPQSTLKKARAIAYGASTKDYVVVATTRPETMLGDVAVAVHPKDKRYQWLRNKELILPLLNRRLKVIFDSAVDPDFGTGAVKVTPAHDPEDFQLAKKHRLTPIIIMHPDGRMNENTGEYNGLDRFKCREKILEDLKNLGVLEKIQNYTHSVGHCYRCDTIIEPYLSLQWFVRTKPLAYPAIKVVKEKKIKFYPPRWKKVYLDWMENIRDWCISRQIWWGHRIPVYYCKRCQKRPRGSTVFSPRSREKTETVDYGPLPMDNKGVIVSRNKPKRCPQCGSTQIRQDEDVLDTWFSSWLWPFSTLGWPIQSAVSTPRPREKTETVDYKASTMDRKDLDYFYPTSVLVTASEILFFWVARMIMAGLEVMREVPFRDVYIHGTVRDLTGKKMSKSLGNIIDPLEIIEEFGADALRFSIISLTGMGGDLFLSTEKFHAGRNFANKIWNASRFILMNVEDSFTAYRLVFTTPQLPLAERWILSRLQKVIEKVTKSLQDYNFNAHAQLIYEFFWHEFCDWYIELAKLEIVKKDEAKEQSKKQIAQSVLIYVLETSLRLLHPIMPFVTEEIWQRLKEKLPHISGAMSIMIASWPKPRKRFIDEDAEKEMALLIELITKIRNLRSEMHIPPDMKISLLVKTTKKKEAFLKANINFLQGLLKLESITFSQDIKKPELACTVILKDMEVFIPLKDKIDLKKERIRIEQKIAALDRELDRRFRWLKNKKFLKNAPREILIRERKRKEEIEDELAKWKNYRRILIA